MGIAFGGGGGNRVLAEMQAGLLAVVGMTEGLIVVRFSMVEHVVF